ncbi:MAG: hypothetical protein ACPGRX_09540, partial [Bdellovibrionales bacterium]
KRCRITEPRFCGADVGTVIAVPNFGAGDLLEIKPKSGTMFLLPFNDDTITDVNDQIIISNFEHFLNHEDTKV